MPDDAFIGPLTVLGAGVMGAGIAATAAAHGLPVRLHDVARTQLDTAQERIMRDVAAGVAKGVLDEDLARSGLDQLVLTDVLAEACAGTALVIEAAPERLDLKRELFAAVDALRPGVVVATNTSALPVTAIAAALPDPGRGIGMHFFNPVLRMRLCELVVGEGTTPETLALARAAATAMGRTSVVVQDRPGFATSRVNAIIGNEGLRMLEEGVASAEDIDTAVRLGLNHPMGPLEMIDLVGLDVRLAVLEHLEATLGERFTPTAVHRRLVAEGRLGRKSGRGVYRYDADGRRIPGSSDLDRA